MRLNALTVEIDEELWATDDFFLQFVQANDVSEIMVQPAFLYYFLQKSASKPLDLCQENKVYETSSDNFWLQLLKHRISVLDYMMLDHEVFRSAQKVNYFLRCSKALAITAQALKMKWQRTYIPNHLNTNCWW